ncbi:MAG: helix-turn-helix domain-containing protein [Pedobacter sp.]
MNILNKLSRKEMKTIYGGYEHYIRRYRDEQCLSQEYMATKLGISQSTYQKIETGRVNVNKERLIEIANILGKEMEDFLPNSRKNNIDKSDIDALKEIIALQAKEIKELKLLLSQKGRLSKGLA